MAVKEQLVQEFITILIQQLMSRGSEKDRSPQKSIEKLPNQIREMLGPVLSAAINVLGARMDEALDAHLSAVERVTRIAQQYAEIGRPLSKKEIAYIGQPFEDIEKARLEAKRDVEKVMLRPGLAMSTIDYFINLFSESDPAVALYDIQSGIADLNASIGEARQMERMNKETQGFYAESGMFMMGQSLALSERSTPASED